MKRRKYTLRAFFLFVGLVLMGTVAVMVASNAVIASGTIRRQTYEILDSAAAIQAQHIRDGLDDVAAYAAAFVYDNANVVTLETGNRSSSEWFAALNRMRYEFDTAMSYQLADNFFLYIPAQDIMFTGTASMLPEGEKLVMRALDNGSLQPRRWQAIQCGGNSYLIYCVKVNSSWVGAWVGINSILSDSDSPNDEAVIDISDSSGILLGTDAFQKGPKKGSGGQTVTLDGKRYLLVSQPITANGFSLAVMMPYMSLWSSVLKYLAIVIPLVLAAFLVLFWVTRAAWRGIMEPARSLTEAIRGLRAGDAGSRAEVDTACLELMELGDAFNEMVEEISNLKIGVYEEQLQRQNIEIEYLKMQVTPHFLVNCLNTVYQLTEAEQPELTMKMVRDLNSHIRYMLSAEVMVPMSQELDLAQNYVDLSSIRYPGCLELVTDYDPAAMNATAIPLLVLNFVENTIKYEAGMGRHLEIHVTTRVDRSGDAPRLLIEIWDTGRGFSPDKLEALQDLRTYVKDNRHRHIGISNVFLRSELVMGECGFRFSNRPGAGAQINIDMPFVPYYRKGEKSNDAPHS